MNKKIISLLTSGLLVSSLMVGCSSTDTDKDNSKYTTQYLTEQGKEAVKNCKEDDYIEITEWTPLMSNYLDTKVKVIGTVKSLHLNDKMTKFLLDVEDNNTPFPLEVKIPGFNIDVEFKEGDTITVNGRFGGLETDEYNGEKFSYWTISAYYLEKGDTAKESKEATSKDEAYNVKEENTKENTGDKTTNNNAKDSMEVKNKTSKNESVGNKTQSKTTEKVTHKCFRCGKNATTYEGQWMCNDCYSEKIAHEEDEEFVNTDDAMQDDGYFYCKGCGKQMTDNNGGTYACDDCLNNN